MRVVQLLGGPRDLGNGGFWANQEGMAHRELGCTGMGSKEA